MQNIKMRSILQRLNVLQLCLVNILFIFAFMIVNSTLCDDGLSGGECVKHLDNNMFLFQMGINLAFSIYYLVVINKKKWDMLVLNYLIMLVFYAIAATLHSISKAGLF